MLTRKNLKITGFLGLLSATALLFTNAGVPQSEIRALAREAAALQADIEGGSFSAEAVKILRAQKLLVDNVIAGKILAKDCEDLRQAEPTLTEGIYNLYPEGEAAGVASVYCEINGNRTVTEIMDFPGTSCEITQTSCPAHPQSKYVGTFIERDGKSDWNKASCLAKAAEYHKWCKNLYSTAKFLEGRTVAGQRTVGTRPCKVPGSSKTIAHGQSIKLFREGLARNRRCVSETRYCTDGSLTGSYDHQSCREWRYSPR